MSEVKARIQAMIDNYSIAGANLLQWLSEDDLRQAPQPRRYLFGFIQIPPSRREWEEWASDVACRATFAALREASDGGGA